MKLAIGMKFQRELAQHTLAVTCDQSFCDGHNQILGKSVKGAKNKEKTRLVKIRSSF